MLVPGRLPPPSEFVEHVQDRAGVVSAAAINAMLSQQQFSFVQQNEGMDEHIQRVVAQTESTLSQLMREAADSSSVHDGARQVDKTLSQAQLQQIKAALLAASIPHDVVQQVVSRLSNDSSAAAVKLTTNVEEAAHIPSRPRTPVISASLADDSDGSTASDAFEQMSPPPSPGKFFFSPHKLRGSSRSTSHRSQASDAASVHSEGTRSTHSMRSLRVSHASADPSVRDVVVIRGLQQSSRTSNTPRHSQSHTNAAGGIRNTSTAATTITHITRTSRAVPGQGWRRALVDTTSSRNKQRGQKRELRTQQQNIVH